MNIYKFLNDNFLSNNLKIFPIAPNAKTPLVAWKEDASSEKLQIVYWLENAKNCNWALPSTMNNLFVIDIDTHNGVDGLKHFGRLITDLGIADEHIVTLQQYTPSGGIHLIFKSDEELNMVKNKAQFFKNYPGIDIRTNGYILVAPSVINGKTYRFSGTFDDVVEMPQKLKDYILKCNTEYETETKKVTSLYELDKIVEEGTRDETMFAYINNLYNKTNLNFNEIKALALAYNKDCFNPPLKERDITYKIRRMFKEKRDKLFMIRISEELDNKSVVSLDELNSYVDESENAEYMWGEE